MASLPSQVSELISFEPKEESKRNQGFERCQKIGPKERRFM